KLSRWEELGLESRRKIVEAAAALMAERGFAGTSVARRRVRPGDESGRLPEGPGALQALGIGTVCATTAADKGRVERGNHTLQDWLSMCRLRSLNDALLAPGLDATKASHLVRLRFRYSPGAIPNHRRHARPKFAASPYPNRWPTSAMVKSGFASNVRARSWRWTWISS